MWLFVLVLVLLSPVTTVTAVTGCHSDRDKDDRPRQNCTAAGFSSLPAGIERSTKVLLFPRNLFTSLSWSSFQVFEAIYEIDLTDNKVPEVTPRVSPTLPTLSVLRLGWNLLKSLPAGSFSVCPALTELYLDNNNIESLSDHTFSGLSKLEILELSSNRIKLLPELMLHPLPAIETLFLESNKIRVMPDNWFVKKEEVPYLYLSINPWACSCSLGYFHQYLGDHELNFYVRDGPNIRSDAESVVCDSPPLLKDNSLVTLEESDLCPEEGTLPTTPPTTPPTTTTTPPTTIPTTPPLPPTIPTTTPLTTIPTTTPVTTIPTTTPLTTIPTTTPPTTPPTTTLPTAPASTFVSSVDHTVFTWSWYETFTRFFEWSGHSEDERRIDGSNVLHTSTSHPTWSSAAMSTTASRKPATTTPALSTVPSTTPMTPGNTSRRIPEPARVSSVGAVALYCCWLFAACVLLCAASAACALATVARLLFWYRRAYKPLSLALARRRRDGRGVRLSTFKNGGEKKVSGGGGGGVAALYRSVLLVHREGETTEREDGVREGEGGGGTVKVEPTEEVRRGERGVYRNTLHRLVSKEEAITGWRDVTEEQDCVSAGDGGRSRGDVSRKRYSVILREERGEAEGGRGEVEWVVGGWEVKGGGDGAREEEQRSSWGEWLTQYLPSMPWGVTTPPEGEAAQ
ncbi:platelet glycoprotein Ib alpha chain [Solea solea]|uniref:platelet glycoprotein Ib alpha chain n=1 Tax=Solea solea TaxID=90069 RepID=UPI0027298E3C|nr:platelet glycoprotein Ib alpha chain [Solea solea]